MAAAISHPALVFVVDLFLHVIIIYYLFVFILHIGLLACIEVSVPLCCVECVNGVSEICMAD